MNAHPLWIAATVALGACSSRAAVKINPDAEAVTSRWNAILETPPGLAGAVQLKGTGWMAAARDSAHTRAGVEISNAAPGGRHPWHVHHGQCGNDLGILGEANAYPVLEVGSEGRATGTAQVDVPFPKSGEYFINVHASPTNLGTIIACGNLAPPAQ